MTLTRFTELYKAGVSIISEKHLHNLSTFSERFSNKITRRYSQNTDEEGNGTLCRPSAIGKHHLSDLLMSKFWSSSKSTTGEKLNLIFSMGDYLEEWLSFTLRRLDYQVRQDIPVKINKHLEGTADIIVTDDDGQDILLEIKSASDYYFNQVLRSGVDDERGYLTQLALYSKGLDLPAYWVFVNKNTADLAMIPLSYAQDVVDLKYEEALEKAEMYHEYMGDFRVWHPPAIEKNKKGEYQYHNDGTLKMYIPCNCLYPDLYYTTFEGKTNYNKKRIYIKELIGTTDSPEDLAIQWDVNSREISSLLFSYFQIYLKES